MTLLLVCMVGAGLALSPPHSMSQAHQPTGEQAAELRFSAIDTGNDLWDVALAGARFTSRDDVEGRLLLETARLARSRGMKVIVLVPRPGEGTGTHPARPVPSYGARYTKWHAQWFYQLERERWQTWRPESGAIFWADQVQMSRLRVFEAHALVRLASGSDGISGDLFDPAAVISDLSPIYGAGASR